MKETLLSVSNIYYKVCTNRAKNFYYRLKDLLKKLIGRSLNYRIVRAHEKMLINNISFELRRGEIIGLLGTEDSCKSELFKLVKGELKVANGDIIKNGVLVSIEDIQNKLNYRKTGRENIIKFLPHLRPDLTKTDILIEEIIAFGNLNDMIDQPIYSYSKGMIIQLEIAILLHINAHIFLIDKQLGGNNIIFNNRILSRIIQLKLNGKGVILTDIGLNNLKRVCDKGIVLSRDSIKYESDINDAIERFENELRKEEVTRICDTPYELQKEEIEFIDMGILDMNTSKSISIGTNDHLNFFCDLKIKKEINELSVLVNFSDVLNKPVLSLSHLFNEYLNDSNIKVNNGVFRLILQLPKHNFVPEIYFPTIEINSPSFNYSIGGNWPRKPFYVYKNNTIDKQHSIATNWMLNPLSLNTENKNVFSILNKGDIAIDCGANIGDVTALMADFGATVYAFEPNPYAFKILSKRFENQNNVILINKGVWNKAGSMPLYLHKDNDSNPEKHSVSASILENKKNIDKSNYVEIELIDLIDFIENLNQKITILKLDIEGAEVDVLNKLIVSKSINKIEQLLVETHEKQMPELFEPTKELRMKIKKLGLKNINLNWV